MSNTLTFNNVLDDSNASAQNLNIGSLSNTETAADLLSNPNRRFPRKTPIQIKNLAGPISAKAARSPEDSPKASNSGSKQSQDVFQKGSNMNSDSNAYDTHFKPMVFIKFLVMHMLFFLALGPFIFILIPVFGKHVLYNQGFLFRLKFDFINQTLQYLALATLFTLYYVTDTPGLQGMEVYMLVIAVAIRLIMIACKYAYQHEDYIKLLFTVTLEKKDLQGDLMLGGWREQRDDLIEEEIQAAILRLEIDSSLFFFTFLGDIGDPEILKKLSKKHSFEKPMNNLEVQKKQNSSSSSKIVPVAEMIRKRQNPSTFNMDITQIIEEEENVQGPGDINSDEDDDADSGRKAAVIEKEGRLSRTAQLIMRSFAYFTKKKKLEESHLYAYNLAFDMLGKARDQRFNHLGKALILFSLFRSLIPTFYRIYLVYYEKEDILVWTEKPYLVVIIILVNTFFFWINAFTLFIGVVDVESKIFCFKQLSYLISPKRLTEYKLKKLYPSFNIFDPVALITWSNLRKVLKEYGKKYYLRTNFNVTITMGLYLIVLAMMVLQILGMISTFSDNLLMIVFAYENLVLFGIFVIIIIGASFINSQCGFHMNLMKKNKTVISNFQRLSYLYVGKNAIQPDNCLYKEGLRRMREELGSENFEEKLVARAEKLTAIMDDIIEDLEFEERHEPATVMGFPVDYGVLKTIGVFIVTVLFAIGQKIANDRMNDENNW